MREGLIAAINALNEVIGFTNETPVIYAATATLGQVAASSHSDFTINFPAGKFSGNVIVVCQLYSSSTNAHFGSMQVVAMDVSNTGFTARVYNDSATAFTPALRYIAYQDA